MKPERSSKIQERIWSAAAVLYIGIAVLNGVSAYDLNEKVENAAANVQLLESQGDPLALEYRDIANEAEAERNKMLAYVGLNLLTVTLAGSTSAILYSRRLKEKNALHEC